MRRFVWDHLRRGYRESGVADLARELAEGKAAKEELSRAQLVLALVLERMGGSVTLTRAEMEDVQLYPDRAPRLYVADDPVTGGITVRATRKHITRREGADEES
ncbi:MAG: hypothetical protein AB1941_09970 [Gemmatimonadota bacterium]